MEQGIAQLREVFNSFDEKQTGFLGHDNLVSLCNQLQLGTQTDVLIRHLLRDNSNGRVDFNDFKEGFIALLTSGNANQDRIESDEDDDDDDDMDSVFASNREVSPKFVLGAKKYGRRSRPASVIESEGMDSISVEQLTETEIYVTSSTKSLLKLSEGKSECSSLSSNSDISETKLLQNLDLKNNTLRSHEIEINMSLPSTPEHPRFNCALSRNSSFQSQSDSENLLLVAPEEYLRNLWKRLGIGKSGYLNLEELGSVCSHIGMEPTNETVAQLFEKLDRDHDGKVTFEELLQGLFQHEVPEAVKSPAASISEMSFTSSPVNHRVFRHGSQEETQVSEPSTEAGFFSAIDPEKGGYVSASAIVDLWESLNIPCGMQLLKDLGFDVGLKINLQDLTLLLEEELANASNDHVYQVALTTLQNEVRHTKTMTAQLKTERDKLRESVAETNERAALLAQEIDDHHARLEESSRNEISLLEKKHQDQIRDLQEELRRERESLTTQMANIKQLLEKELEASHAEESNLKKELIAQKADNNRLEKELHDLLTRLSDSEDRNEKLQKELDSLADVRLKLSEFELSTNDERCEVLSQEIEELRRQNKDLQDHTLELTLEIENLKLMANSNTNNKRHNRNSSWLADYNKYSNDISVNGNCSLKRRGSGSSSDGISEDDSRMVGKVRRCFPITGNSEEPMAESFDVSSFLDEDQMGFTIPVPTSRREEVLTSSNSYPKFTETERDEKFSSLQTSNPNDQASQANFDKDQFIARLREKYNGKLSSQEKKLEEEIQSRRELQVMVDSMKSEIQNTVCELYELVQHFFHNSETDNPLISNLKKKIEDRFSKVLLMADRASNKENSQSHRANHSADSFHSATSAEQSEYFDGQPNKMDTLLRDLYLENGRLVKELKTAEEQRLKAEHGNMRLHYKCKVLQKLVADITHASVN